MFEGVDAGTDLVVASASCYLYTEIENLTLTGGSDLFGVGNGLANVITGNTGGNLLIAGAGNDVLEGSGGADVIYGEAGNDVMLAGDDFIFDMPVAGDGDDTLYGDSGFGDFDYLYGNNGNDVFYVDTPFDLVFEQPGDGFGTVYARIDGAGYYLYENIENLVLLDETPFGVGNGLGNSITGNAIGNVLLGGAGNDSLNGKAGTDVLSGEAGIDYFVMERGNGGDVIGDFTIGEDKIVLSGLGFANFAAVRAAMVENDGVTAINLGFGDFLVVFGVPNAALKAGDFLLGWIRSLQRASVSPMAVAHRSR